MDQLELVHFNIDQWHYQLSKQNFNHKLLVYFQHQNYINLEYLSTWQGFTAIHLIKI
jgi:hypothetical protein